MIVNEWFFEFYNGCIQEGWGEDSRSTMWVYRMFAGLLKRPQFLDVGWGSGMLTVELAKISNTEITVGDIHQPFLNGLVRRAKVVGVNERIKVLLDDMNE
jgi:ubiquinone/menaquinone biosynthesis C-methylase UbiE